MKRERKERKQQKHQPQINLSREKKREKKREKTEKIATTTPTTTTVCITTTATPDQPFQREKLRARFHSSRAYTVYQPKKSGLGTDPSNLFLYSPFEDS